MTENINKLKKTKNQDVNLTDILLILICSFNSVKNEGSQNFKILDMRKL